MSLGLAPVIVSRLLPVVREFATSNSADAFVASAVRYAALLVVVVKAGIRLFCCPPGGEYARR
jgi:hypothetical protein